MLNTKNGQLAALKEQLADYTTKRDEATVKFGYLTDIINNLRSDAGQELAARLDADLIDATGPKTHWTNRCNLLTAEIDFIEKNGYPSWCRIEDLQRAASLASED